MGLVLSCDTILVDMGDHAKRFNRGDSLEGIPAGALISLQQMRRVCEASELLPTEPPVEEIAEVEVKTVPAATDWKATKVASLQLSARILEALAKANLTTAGEVAEYGAAHDGSLEDLPGISKASDKAIQAAIAALLETSKGGES